MYSAKFLIRDVNDISCDPCCISATQSSLKLKTDFYVKIEFIRCKEENNLATKLHIRQAKLTDIDLIFEWSNDQLVREQSFHSDVISYVPHCEWFKNKLTDKTALIYIVEADGEPASMLRIDVKTNNAVIGVVIGKEFRGEGLASISISKGVAEYFKSNSLPILASIKKQNIASIKAFKKAGFSYLRDEKINQIDSVVYQMIKA
jgi:UDP-2,4-diacetamido-2,4,6-trideoxy-beta-L-altropyranose hydrolase